jgi:hypothetical protein
MADLRRRDRKVTTAVVAAAAVVVAGLDVLWGIYGQFVAFESHVLLIGMAIVFAGIAGLAPLLRSSRNGLGVASVSLAMASAQLVVMCMAVRFDQPKPNPRIAQQLTATLPEYREYKDTPTIDAWEKEGILSKELADGLRERANRGKNPTFGDSRSRYSEESK